MKILNYAAATTAATILSTAVTAQDANRFYGEAEVLQFQWTDTAGDEEQKDFSTGSRYTFGYNLSDTGAVRLRYFTFSAEDADSGDTFKTEHADLEYVTSFALGAATNAEFSAGLRWLAMETPEQAIWKDSYGPVVGAKVTSDLGRGFAIYGGGRSSLVFGEETIEEEQHQIGTTELMTGINWTGDIGAGTLGVNLGVEAHQYSSVRDGEEDYGLVGFVLGASYSF